MNKFILSLTILLASLSAAASPNEAEIQNAWRAAEKVAVTGPSQTNIANQANLTIPEGYAFIPQKESASLMLAMGNGEIPDLKGILVGTKEGSNGNGLYIIEYHKDGYVKDDDAKDLDADDVLNNYKEGTEAGNKERTAKGFPAIEVTGWAQKPVYDEKLHRLTWALISHDKGVTTSSDDTINYETRLLGREGVLSITWIAALSELNGAGKAKADQISAGIQYIDDKKYDNFNASAGDKVAEYGLTALITGVAIKKLGLFAVIAAFFAKFAKIIVVALFAMFPVFRRIFKKKDKPSTESQASSNTAVQSSDSTEIQQGELTDTTKL